VRTNGSGTRIELDLKTEVEPSIFASRPGAGRHLLTLDVYTGAPSMIARTPPADGGVEQEALLDVQINGQPVAGTIVALRGSDGRISVRNDDLRRWRFRVPAPPPIPPITPGREAHQPLDALPGLAYRVDEATQTLHVQAPPALFIATAIPGQANVFAVPPPAPPGAFANYDAFASHAEGKTFTSGQVEVGVFNAWGVGVSDFLGRSSGPGAHWVRLDTTWTHDMPASVSSLRIGDAISAPGSWGRSVRFGGVQWATNFVTQPSFITFPLPGVRRRGGAALDGGSLRERRVALAA
jgi:outer membrane usher protein